MSATLQMVEPVSPSPTDPGQRPQPAVELDPQPGDLSALSDDDFLDLVFAHRNPHAPGLDWSQFLAPEILDRTARAISELRRDLDSTSREKREELHPDAHRRWVRQVYTPTRDWLSARRKTVDDRRRALHLRRTEHKAAEARAAVARLARAIQRHRLATLGCGFDPEPHDRQLWSLLSKATLTFGDVPRTLDEALADGVWRFDDDHAETDPS